MQPEQRITRPEYFLTVARLTAMRSTCKRMSVGCVIVKDHRIISTGYNGALPNHAECSDKNCDISYPCQIAVHAEANAITWAAKEGLSLKDTSIWCTHLPCQKCTELIIQAGIKDVFYLKTYRVSEGISTLRASGINIQQIDLGDLNPLANF